MVSVDVEKDLGYVYGWNYYTMKFMGIWPEERGWKQRSSYLVLVPIFFMLCFVCIPQTANIPNIRHNLYLLVDNFSMANLTVFLSFFKTVTFWMRGTSLKSLLKYMAIDWSVRTRPNDRVIMMNVAKFSRRTILVSTMCCNLLVGAYVVKHRITAKYTDRKLFFHAIFPYDVSTNPNLELTIFGQLVAGMYSAGTYTAVDTFIVMLVLHVCGQLAILKQDMLNLQEHQGAQLQAALADIVQRHEYINRFARTIENCFTMMLLVQMLGCTMQLCFQAFQAIMTLSGEEKELMLVQTIFLFLYLLYIMAQLYLYCYVGEKLATESAGIATTAFNCGWHKLPSKKAKLLVIIMCRGKSPLRITAGKFCSFTLELYSEIS
ncbi:odorant receptor 13a-like isoform X2 [Nomia melanderi]|uniref:odorant receptor 13a-like isoform X2 n=1 Tax=Nomia melanderi TaxID=2448451 RepID=UPI003FCE3DD4